MKNRKSTRIPVLPIGTNFPSFFNTPADEVLRTLEQLADEVLVLNVDEYIGDSTRSEIEYAKESNKVIRYLED